MSYSTERKKSQEYTRTYTDAYTSHNNNSRSPLISISMQSENKMSKETQKPLNLKIPLQHIGEMKLSHNQNLSANQLAIENINSWRMGSESTNNTARVSGNNATPNITKNNKFCLNLAFSNQSKQYFSSYDQQDSFRTTRQQVLIGQLTKRSQIINQTKAQKELQRCTTSNRISEFLMKTSEKTQQFMKKTQNTYKPSILSPYLSNFLSGSPENNASSAIRKMDFFKPGNTFQQTRKDHNRDCSQDSVGGYYNSVDYRKISGQSEVFLPQNGSPMQYSNFQGSPPRFHETVNYFNIQERFSILSGQKELTTDNYSQSRSQSQTYLHNTLQRALTDNVNLFAVPKRDSIGQKIPKVVKADHLVSNTSSIEQNDKENHQAFNQSSQNLFTLKSKQTDQKSIDNETTDTDKSSLHKMYAIDKIKRKVSPSMLLDNYMNKTAKQFIRGGAKQPQLNKNQLLKQKVKEKLNQYTMESNNFSYSNMEQNQQSVTDLRQTKKYNNSVKSKLDQDYKYQ